MTPEEHWNAAEALIRLCQQSIAAGETVGALPAMAQVHATLALAGATLLAGAAGCDAARDRLADAVLGAQR